MSIFKNKKRWISIFVLVTVISLTTVIGILYFQRSTVSALPCHEVEHYYYSDATYGTQVGYRFVTCHGVYTQGQVTQYVVSFDGDYCYDNCPGF